MDDFSLYLNEIFILIDMRNFDSNMYTYWKYK